MPDEPLYVTQVTIENVRCFAEQQVLDLTTASGAPAMWTTILGENGTGKTTLLKVLALGATFEHRQGDLFPRLATSSETPGWLRAALAPPAHRPWAPPPAPAGARPHPASAVIRAGARLGSARLAGHGVWHADDSDGSSPGSGVQWNADGSAGWTYTSGLPGQLSPVLGYGASRLPSATSLGDAPIGLSGLDSLLNGGATLVNAEEWLLRLYFDRVLDPGGPAARQYDLVRVALIDVLPDVVDIPEPRKPEDPRRAGQLKGRIRFVTPDGEVAFDDLSLGYQTMTAWVVDLAARLFDHYPDSPNPLAEPAIVLVDEIDLHLHPRWQRDLVRWLRSHFPRTQFVVTAHSPLVVQATEDANVVVLRRSPDGTSVVIDNDPEVVHGWRVDQILTSTLYGLESARSPAVEEKLERRRTLATKARRSRKEQSELAELDSWAESLPTADRPEDQEALDVLRRAAAMLVSDGER